MHELNTLLIDNVELYQETFPKDIVVRELLKQYRLASKMSIGPDASRSKYWAEKATELERRLYDYLFNKKSR